MKAGLPAKSRKQQESFSKIRLNKWRCLKVIWWLAVVLLKANAPFLDNSGFDESTVFCCEQFGMLEFQRRATIQDDMVRATAQRIKCGESFINYRREFD
jgi:hypothetical protein